MKTLFLAALLLLSSFHWSPAPIIIKSLSGGVITVARHGYDGSHNPATGTSWTSNSVGIGSAPTGQERRWVVACIALSGPISAGKPITGVEINGTAADSWAGGAGSFEWVMIAILEVSSGTTATVTVNWTNSVDPAIGTVAFYSLRRHGPVTMNDSEVIMTRSGDQQTLDPITVSNGGVAVLQCFGYGTANVSFGGTGMGSGTVDNPSGARVGDAYGEYVSGSSLTDLTSTITGAGADNYLVGATFE